MVMTCGVFSYLCIAYWYFLAWLIIAYGYAS